MEKRLQFRLAKSKAFEWMIVLFAFLITLPLLAIIFYVLKTGLSKISWHFLTHIPQPVGGIGGGAEPRFHQSDEHAAEHGSGHAADTAEDRGDESFEARHDSHVWLNSLVIERVENSAGASEGGAEAECERNDDVVVHAHQRSSRGIE